MQSEILGGALPALGAEDEDQLRKMILAMVDEPLVIVVKLADRLHNMRTVRRGRLCLLMSSTLPDVCVVWFREHLVAMYFATRMMRASVYFCSLQDT